MRVVRGETEGEGRLVRRERDLVGEAEGVGFAGRSGGWVVEVIGVESF